MIEEKNLKVSLVAWHLRCCALTETAHQKTFIIATLISTIIGTFTTGINLYERVAERRNQKHRDSGQDAKIRELERRADEAKAERDKHRENNKDLRKSLADGGSMVRREYEQDFKRLGSRFAEGDCTSTTATSAG